MTESYMKFWGQNYF